MGGCGGGGADPDSDLEVKIIDYRSAYIYEPNSNVNKLFIGVNSRLTVNDSRGERSYLLLKEHPRESTFDPARSPYLETVRDELGASFITFIYGVNIDSVVVSRRYSVITNDNRKYLQECRSGKNFEKNYRDFRPTELKEVDPFEIGLVPQSGVFYVGSFEYQTGGTSVVIDFPISLVNFNPIQSPSIVSSNLFFQVVSTQVPIYLPVNNAECDSIVPGYLAFRAFDGSAQAVYICEYSQGGVSYYDYGCVVDLKGRFRLFSTF
jgi:hypothetical protein